MFDFFATRGLTAELLRTVNRHQIDRLGREFDALGLDPSVVSRDRNTPPDDIGGFLALRSPQAKALHTGLKARGVSTDFRDELLRFGPAPYLSDRQLDDAIAALGETAASRLPPPS